MIRIDESIQRQKNIILNIMVENKIMFHMPKIIFIKDGKYIKTEYQWTNIEAEKTHNQCQEMLSFLDQRIMKEYYNDYSKELYFQEVINKRI